MYRKTSDPITVWVHFSLIKSGGRRRGGGTVTSPAAPQHKLELFDIIPEIMHCWVFFPNLLFCSVSIFYLVIGWCCRNSLFAWHRNHNVCLRLKAGGSVWLCRWSSLAAAVQMKDRVLLKEGESWKVGHKKEKGVTSC